MVINRRPRAPEALEDQRLELLDLLREPTWFSDALCREPAYADIERHPQRGQDTRPAAARPGRFHPVPR